MQHIEAILFSDGLLQAKSELEGYSLANFKYKEVDASYCNKCKRIFKKAEMHKQCNQARPDWF